MLSIDNNKIKVTFYDADQITFLTENKISLFGFLEWYEKVKKINAKIIPNGIESIIIMTELLYIIVTIE